MASAAFFCVAFVAFTGLVHVDGHHYKHSSLLLALHKYRGTSSIFLTFSHNDDDLQKYTWAQRLTREFSREKVMTLVTDFKDLHERVSWYRKRILRPLVVVLFHQPSDIAEFNESTKLMGLRYPIWLMIFSDERGKPFCEYCKSPGGRIFPLRFDTEMIVFCCDDPMLKEWWAVNQNRTEMTDYAIWKNSHDLEVLRSKELYLRRYDVKGAALRVGVITSSALVYEDGKHIEGFFGNILTEFQHKMNFTITNIVRDPSYGSWDAETKKWTGLLNRMSRGEIDVGVGGFAITNSRRNIVDFTIPLMITRNKLFVKNVDNSIISWSAYYKAFAINIWIAIVMLITTASILITVIKFHRRPMPWFFLFCENYITIWGMFCQQSLSELPASLSLKIAYFWTWFAALVIPVAYSASLISFLTVSSTMLPFRTLDDFIKDGSYKLIVLRNSATYDFFKTSTDPVLMKMKALMKPVEQLPVDIASAWEHTCNEKVAFYTAELQNEESDRNIKCKVSGIDTGRIVNLAMIWSAGSQFTDAFNYHVLNLQDRGLMGRIKKKYLTWDTPVTYETFDDVTFWDALPVLSIWAGGLILAVLVLFFEKMYYSWKKLVRNKTRWIRLRPIKNHRLVRVFEIERSLKKQNLLPIAQRRAGNFGNSLARFPK